MLKDIIVNQVKELIIKAIKRNAKILGMSEYVTGIMISANDEEGNAKLELMCNMRPKKELFVNDLYSTVEAFTYKTMGFDVDSGTKEWLKKFIIKASADKELDIIKPNFYLFLMTNAKERAELYAVMYIDGKQVRFSQTRSDIPLDYILETK